MHAALLFILMAQQPFQPGNRPIIDPGISGQPSSPYVPFDAIGPRQRRAAREAVVARLGPASRPLIEAFDEAVPACLGCSPPVALQLAEFHNAGGFSRLPRASEVLQAIAGPGRGDDIARFVIASAGALQDPDAMDAFLLDPLDYSLALRSLADGAAKIRARKQPWWQSPWALAGGLGGAVVLVLIARSWQGRPAKQ